MPSKQPEAMPTPEEILEAGERLAGMVERAWSNCPAAMYESRGIRDTADQAARAVRVRASGRALS